MHGHYDSYIHRYMTEPRGTLPVIWKCKLPLLISADVNVIDVKTTLRSKLALPLRRAPVQLLLEILRNQACQNIQLCS